jgi:cyclophilin family peptidyl-prolyl cis-trans isomerase
MNASQFYITLAADLDSLDEKHTVFGEVGPVSTKPYMPTISIACAFQLTCDMLCCGLSS